jgi:hypothetical protein
MNYILKSFPDLNPISFHGFISGKTLEIVSMLIQTHIKLPSKYYFLQSFPGFYSISFHGFKSGEKCEDYKFFGDFYSKAQRALLQNEV